MPDNEQKVSETGICAIQKRLLWIGSVSSAVLLLAGMVISWGADFEKRVELFKWIVSTCGVIMGVAMAASGFAVGQLFKGVVPEGFLPAGDAKESHETKKAAVALIATEPLPVLDRDIVKAAVREALNDTFSGMPSVVPPAAPLHGIAEPGALQQPPRLPLWILPLLMLPFFAGCASTSTAFQKSIVPGVNNVVQDMREYTTAHDWDENHNGALEVDEQGKLDEEKRLTDALAGSVANPGEITVDAVESAWNGVAPRWRAYIANDPLLVDASDRKIRLDTGVLIDQLISREKERQAAVNASLGLYRPELKTSP
jgi:hypothetical protein